MLTYVAERLMEMEIDAATGAPQRSVLRHAGEVGHDLPEEGRGVAHALRALAARRRGDGDDVRREVFVISLGGRSGRVGQDVGIEGRDRLQVGVDPLSRTP